MVNPIKDFQLKTYLKYKKIPRLIYYSDSKNENRFDYCDNKDVERPCNYCNYSLVNYKLLTI